MGIPLILNRIAPKVYKFGGQRTDSVGKANFRIPYALIHHIILELDFFELDFPLLLGLDVLHKYKLVIDNVNDRLVCKRPPWSTPVTRKLGHLYNVWESKCTQSRS